MTIKRLTNRGPTFPKLGTLRKGAPKGKNRPGKNLTYFRIDTPFPDLEEKFHELYGNEPREIPVFLPFPTVEQNWEAWQEEWVAGGLMHRCDGEVMHLWRDPQSGKMRSDPKPCPYFTGEKQRTRANPGCKPVARLKVVITDLPMFGYFTVLTTSEYDIVELNGVLTGYAILSGNSLSGIPFILSRRPQKISIPGPDGKRVRKEEWLLHLDIDPLWASRRLIAAKAQAFAVTTPQIDVTESVRAVPQLPGFVVDTSTGEILEQPEDEFSTITRLAMSYYGDDWQTELSNLIKRTTVDRSELSDLTPEELDSLKQWLERKIASLPEATSQTTGNGQNEIPW